MKQLIEECCKKLRFSRTIPSTLTVEDIKNCSFMDDKRNLIFYGNVGTGNYRKFWERI